MPRAAILIFFVLLVVLGLLWFLSSQAEEVPTRTIEVEVNAPANAG